MDNVGWLERIPYCDVEVCWTAKKKIRVVDITRLNPLLKMLNPPLHNLEAYCADAIRALDYLEAWSVQMSCFDGRIREYPGVIVDCFSSENCHTYGRVFFLSHCHKDHMEGLGRPPLVSAFLSGADGLYCSEVTHRLLLRDPEFSHLKKHIKKLPLGTTVSLKIRHPRATEVEDLSITLLPANHCPGSVMFLFEGQNGTVLFTGDFRLDVSDLQQMAALHSSDRSLKLIRNLYLDTTFCHPKLMTIPSREKSQEITLALIEKWLSESPHHLVHLRCSTLGYEHILMAVSKHFRTKIHVHPFTERQYQDLPSVAECITTDRSLTRVHACSWKLYKSKGTSLPCGVQAVHNEKTQVMRIKLSTIWFTQLSDGFPESGSVHLSRYNVWRVPHSMHSSMSEIRNVVEYLHPQKITPIVVPVCSKSLPEASNRLKDLLDSTSCSDSIESSPLLCLQRPSQWSTSNVKATGNLFDNAVLSDDAGLSPPKRKCAKRIERIVSPAPDDERPVGKDVKPTMITDETAVESESDEETNVHSQSYSWPMNERESQNTNGSINPSPKSHRVARDVDCPLCRGGTISSFCSECGSQDADSEWSVSSTPGLQDRPNIHELSALHHKLSVEQYLPLQCVRDLSSDFTQEDEQVRKHKTHKSCAQSDCN